MKYGIVILWLSLAARSSLAAPLNQASYDLGVVVNHVVPDELPAFSHTLLSIGPQISLPLLGFGAFQLEGQHGKDDVVSLWLGSLSYRIEAYTPFLCGFLLAGVHWLRYSVLEFRKEYTGPHFGFGIKTELEKRIVLTLAFRAYFQERKLLTFGAGLNFEL